jgi:outer membrane protein assembly factor BamD
MNLQPAIGRFFLGVFLSAALLLAPGCATVQGEIDPGIQAEIKEDLSKAPTDELSKSYEPLSLLQKAETFYNENNFVEAASEYEYFLNLHPLHRWASYAQYKLGLSYFHQIETADRDTEPALKALTAFQKLLDIYPDSPFQEATLQKIRFCKDWLAEREFYIGQFYYKKSAYPAAIERFREVVQDYPESKFAETSLYLLALSYQQLGDSDKAKESLKELLEKYPSTKYQKEIKRQLSSSDGEKT